MTKLKIAMIQAAPPQNLREALEAGITQCDLAKAAGADLVLFPELWSHGGWLPASESDVLGWQMSSLEPNSYFVQSFQTWCRTNDLAVCLTFLESHEPLPKNSAVLIDRHGRIVLHESKGHTGTFGSNQWLTSGDGSQVADHDLGQDTIKVGLRIGFDRPFDESARACVMNEAGIVVLVVAARYGEGIARDPEIVLAELGV